MIGQEISSCYWLSIIAMLYLFGFKRFGNFVFVPLSSALDLVTSCICSAWRSLWQRPWIQLFLWTLDACFPQLETEDIRQSKLRRILGMKAFFSARNEANLTTFSELQQLSVIGRRQIKQSFIFWSMSKFGTTTASGTSLVLKLFCFDS